MEPSTDSSRHTIASFWDAVDCQRLRLFVIIRVVQAACSINSADQETAREELNCLTAKHLTIAPRFGATLVQITLFLFPSKCKWMGREWKLETTAILLSDRSCVCTIVTTGFLFRLL